MKPAGNRQQILLWLFGALSAFLFVAMAIHAAPLSPSIPAIQFTYNEATFKAILDHWGPRGIERFHAHFAIDFPFLACYGVFGYLLARQSAIFDTFGKPTRGFMTWTLPAAAALDACENLFHLHLISGTASHAATLYLVAGLVATSKWILIAVFVTITIYVKLRSRR